MMELKMEVYSPALELLDVLTVYDSLLLEERAFGAGSFSLEAAADARTAALLARDHIIWFEGDTAGVIEAVQTSADEAGPRIAVKGPLLTGLLDRRILWGRYTLHGTAAALMYALVDDCAVHPTRGDTDKRRLPGLVLSGASTPQGGEVIRKQKTGGSLLDALTELGAANRVAFGVRFNAQIPQMEFWARRGVDRTVGQTAVEPVLYSTELDDVLSAEYICHAGDYKNVALVAGEGEGAARAYVTVNGQADPQKNVRDNR